MCEIIMVTEMTTISYLITFQSLFLTVWCEAIFTCIWHECFLGKMNLLIGICWVTICRYLIVSVSNFYCKSKTIWHDGLKTNKAYNTFYYVIYVMCHTYIMCARLLVITAECLYTFRGMPFVVQLLVISYHSTVFLYHSMKYPSHIICLPHFITQA